MSMIGLTKDTHNAEGLGDCKMISTCLDYFDPKKHDKTDKS